MSKKSANAPTDAAARFVGAYLADLVNHGELWQSPHVAKPLARYVRMMMRRALLGVYIVNNRFVVDATVFREPYGDEVGVGRLSLAKMLADPSFLQWGDSTEQDAHNVKAYVKLLRRVAAEMEKGSE